MEYEKLLQTIISLHCPDRSLCIGIDGLGGAGKSTIAEILCSRLRKAGYSVRLLHMDELIHPKAVRYNASVPEWECYYELQWRYDYLRQLLQPIRENRELCTELERYDLDSDSYRRESFNVPVGSIVIVEGIFLQRNALAGLFDLMVYVDVPEDIRLARVLERDGYIGDRDAIAAKYERRYFPAEHHYLRTCCPAERADVVLASE